MNGLEDFVFKNELNRFKVESSSLFLFLILKYLKSKKKKIVFFTKSNSDIEKIQESIKSLNNNILTCSFPSFDCSFFSNLSPTIENKSQRIKTLYNLSQNKDMILISSLDSLVEKTISKNSFFNSRLVLSIYTNINYNNIIDFLKKNNFEHVDFVNNVGEYSKRGEIIDIFSPLHNFPVRIFFNFENIEKIKQFGLAKKMRVTQLYTLEQARIKFARKLSINVSENQPQKIEKLIENLQNFSLEETSDGCPVELNYHTKDGKVGMDLRENFNISLTNDNFDTLKRTCGIKNIDLHYFLRN